jgi:hypothetical protein
VRPSYRYFDAGRDGRGRRVVFAWATVRNCAGYFLGWREVAGKKQTKRDRWTASRTRGTVKARALERRMAFQRERELAQQEEVSHGS